MTTSSTASLKHYLPEKCTEIKVIKGHFYVYRYLSKKLPNGRWRKVSTQCIGKIVEGKVLSPTKTIVKVVVSRQRTAQTLIVVQERALTACVAHATKSQM